MFRYRHNPSLITRIVSSLFCLTILFVSLSHATIYSFTDEKGIIHFTNVPSSSRFRPVSYGNRSSVGIPNTLHKYQQIVSEASHLYGVEAAFINAVIKIESNFDPDAISPKGAKGLMQLMPSTAQDMAVLDSYNPRENIFGGTRYLKKLIQIFEGDLPLVLASYNAGLTRVRNSRTVPDISETKNYVKKVMFQYQQYK